MEEAGLDALVVRAPDNVLYLTNFWGMKGYDAAVFPRDGETTLICLEASAEDAARAAWTNDVRFLQGYAPDDPRPPLSRTLELAQEAARAYGRVDVDLALPFSLVWSGPGIKTFTATGDLPVCEDEPTLFEIWVCADGYWCDHTKNLCPGELSPAYAELEEQLLSVYETLVERCRPGESLAELDRAGREAIAGLGYPGQPTHPLCHGVGARAHEPPYAHQAGAGEITEGMVLAVEPGIYWEGGGGLRVEDNFLVTPGGPEKLSSFPDGIVRAE
jgi:Xaa-Pro aminopeptidase